MTRLPSSGRTTARGIALFCACLLFGTSLPGQTASGQTPPNQTPQPQDRVIGEVTAISKPGEALTVKEDKTGNEYSIVLNATKTFLRIPPGEKDLKKATRITSAEIGVGDRIAARGKLAADNAKTLEAASVLLIKADELAAKRESEQEDWKKRGSAGTIAAVNEASHEVTATVRHADGPKPIIIAVPNNAKLLRYAPDSVKYSDAKPSSFSELQVGDQLRVLGNKSADGGRITAEQLISGPFRTVTATILSITPDGKEMKVTDLETKQPVDIQFIGDSAIRRLPPPMAMMMARRLNPAFQQAEGNGNRSPGQAPDGATAGERRRPGNFGESADAGKMTGPPGNPANGAGARPPSGDLSQLLERLPKISVSELKPGDAVIISGGVSADKARLMAINIIAGVEPLFQSAPPQQGRNAVAGMWNLDMGVPEQ